MNAISRFIDWVDRGEDFSCYLVRMGLILLITVIIACTISHVLEDDDREIKEGKKAVVSGFYPGEGGSL
jgi:hypothetical protein